jgi:ATP-dependent helicase/nuclease subunit A
VAGADRLKLSSHIVFDDLIAWAVSPSIPTTTCRWPKSCAAPFCDVTDFGDAHSLYPLADAQARGGRPVGRAARRADEQPNGAGARPVAGGAGRPRRAIPSPSSRACSTASTTTGQSGRAASSPGWAARPRRPSTRPWPRCWPPRGAAGRIWRPASLLEAADVEVKRELEGARNEVRVMTVHGAKGLEAPVVILPDTTSRSKPQGPTLMPALLDPNAPEDGEGWLMCPGRAGDDCEASAGRVRRGSTHRRRDPAPALCGPDPRPRPADRHGPRPSKRPEVGYRGRQLVERDRRDGPAAGRDPIGHGP